MKILVKGANKSFVARAHAPDNGAQTGLDRLGVLALQVVVNEDDHGDGKDLGGKKGDLLLDLILKDAEFVLPKVGYQIAFPVFYRNRHNHESRVHDDFGRSLALGRGLRGLRRRRRLGRRGGCGCLNQGHGRQQQQGLCN